mgnify:CR=1 FL=1
MRPVAAMTRVAAEEATSTLSAPLVTRNVTLREEPCSDVELTIGSTAGYADDAECGARE